MQTDLTYTPLYWTEYLKETGALCILLYTLSLWVVLVFLLRLRSLLHQTKNTSRKEERSQGIRVCSDFHLSKFTDPQLWISEGTRSSTQANLGTHWLWVTSISQQYLLLSPCPHLDLLLSLPPLCYTEFPQPFILTSMFPHYNVFFHFPFHLLQASQHILNSNDSHFVKIVQMSLHEKLTTVSILSWCHLISVSYYDFNHPKSLLAGHLFDDSDTDP